MRFLLFFFILTSSVFAFDPSISTFKERKQTQRIDRYDFSGVFSNLENIDIDARRKKRVEFDLTGEYPLLETLNYEGGFGHLDAKLTGAFPILQVVNFLCTNCAMEFDLGGKWEQSCEINIRGLKEDVVITLPSDVGLVIHTKTSTRGKVIASDQLKKKGWIGFWNKTFIHNPEAEVVLTLNVETSNGRIFFN